MKKPIVVFWTLLTVLFSSCGESYSVFSSKYPVYYRCDTRTSPFNQVGSSGVFVSIRQSGEELVVSSNLGIQTHVPLTDSERQSFRLGLGGLIIGTPQLDNTSNTVWAYDLACPVCEKAKYRLSVDYLGKATCANCGTVYDLNNNGFVTYSSKKDYRPLLRYPVSVAGSVIIVAN